MRRVPGSGTRVRRTHENILTAKVLVDYGYDLFCFFVACGTVSVHNCTALRGGNIPGDDLFLYFVFSAIMSAQSCREGYIGSNYIYNAFCHTSFSKHQIKWSPYK